ncbi:hypothetical protein OAM02_02790, partial [Verrucomicrobia bacterium]|nr:hypothetical protein [Verrucomicrobiota bacterium]MDC0319494.1 hypothetical protein [Verrucomicrobiota bacterium]
GCHGLRGATATESGFQLNAEHKEAQRAAEKAVKKRSRKGQNLLTFEQKKLRNLPDNEKF